MYFILAIISTIISVKIGLAHGFGAGFFSFFIVPVLMGFFVHLLINYVKSSAANAKSGRSTVTMTMEQGIDLMQKTYYLNNHGAISEKLCDRITDSLSRAKITNERPFRDNELAPPVAELDVVYAEAAVRTLLTSGYLYQEEGERIQAYMDSKLDSIRDEYSDLPRGEMSDLDKKAEEIMKALR